VVDRGPIAAHDAAVGPIGRRLLPVLAVAIAFLTLMGAALLRPGGAPPRRTIGLESFEGVYTATTERRDDVACEGGLGARCVRATFRLLEGPDRDQRVHVELPAGGGRAGSIAVGRHVLLGHQPDVRGFEYVYLDPDRRSPLLLLTVLFAAAVVLLGGWRGAASLVGLVATLVVLFLFIVPAILRGRDPLLVSVVGSVLIAYLALYLSHGFGSRTTVAFLGTLGGLACAALLAVAFMGLAEITGLASEEALYLSAVGTGLDLRGLILGGMIVGALGAIDDMTVTQASAVWELRAADPSMPRRRLLRAGLRIGRDHVASTVNTLVLAYAGASMPVLLLFLLSDQSASTVASSEIVATEIVRTLVGSIGLVASVPITTWLAVRAIAPPVGRHAARTEKQEPEPAHDGDRVVLDRSPKTLPPLGPPEEHPIYERRRDMWSAWLRDLRAGRHR
jgi:uncharacterized membrane protein